MFKIQHIPIKISHMPHWNEQHTLGNVDLFHEPEYHGALDVSLPQDSLSEDPWEGKDLVWGWRRVGQKTDICTAQLGDIKGRQWV